MNTTLRIITLVLCAAIVGLTAGCSDSDEKIVTKTVVQQPDPPVWVQVERLGRAIRNVRRERLGLGHALLRGDAADAPEHGSVRAL